MPSPQSNSSFSPPRRSRVAGRPRRAVGADAAVPAKSTSRSMARPIFASRWTDRRQPHEARSSIDGGLHRPREAHRVRGRPAALRGAAGVEDLEAVRAPRAAACASGRRRRRPQSGKRSRSRARRPSAGPASWTIPICAPSRLDDPLGRQLPAQLVVVDVAVHRQHGRPDQLELGVARSAVITSPACRIRSAAREPLHASVGQPPLAAGQVGVGDDGDHVGLDWRHRRP